MTDDVQGIAAAQLRSIVDRILRLKEEQDAIGDDIKEVYLEAKSNGYDKTILGQVVSTLRKRAKNSADFDEKQAIFDLYMDAVDGGTKAATHTHEASQDRHALTPAAPPGSSAGSTSSPGTEADADPEPISNLSGSPVPDGRAEDGDSSGPAASPSSATTIADLRLIDRVTKSKRKGVPANEAGDSARWQRLVKSGVFVIAAGRLFYRDFAPEHEVA